MSSNSVPNDLVDALLSEMDKAEYERLKLCGLISSVSDQVRQMFDGSIGLSSESAPVLIERPPLVPFTIFEDPPDPRSQPAPKPSSVLPSPPRPPSIA